MVVLSWLSWGMQKTPLGLKHKCGMCGSILVGQKCPHAVPAIMKKVAAPTHHLTPPGIFLRLQVLFPTVPFPPL